MAGNLDLLARLPASVPYGYHAQPSILMLKGDTLSLPLFKGEMQGGLDDPPALLH